MKTKDLVMISFVKNRLKRKVMVEYMYDDVLNQQIMVDRKYISLDKHDKYIDNIMKIHPDIFVKQKIKGSIRLINPKVIDRLKCNLDHMKV